MRLMIAPIAVSILAACSQSSAADQGRSNDALRPTKEQQPRAEPSPHSGAPRLIVPIACTLGQTCMIQNYVDRDPGTGSHDYRCGHETYQDHGGVDFRIQDMAAQRAGVSVLAAAPGRVARVRDGVADVSVKELRPAAGAGQECGNGVVLDHGLGWETQYCHLARGSVRAQVGETVAAGDVIGRVGLSGNTEYAHLHFTVRQHGVVVDPFMPSTGAGDCRRDAAVGGLWTQEAAEALKYQPGAILNFGFAGARVDAASIEAGSTPLAGRTAPALVTYVRAINLQEGDAQALRLVGPGGEVLAERRLPPLDRGKAQYFMYVGARTPTGGWKAGTYSATFTVVRKGASGPSETIRLTLPAQ